MVNHQLFRTTCYTSMKRQPLSYCFFKKSSMTPKQTLPVIHPHAAGIAVGISVEICIADKGTGIPQNIIDKISQPFFTTKPTGQGTGLGLSLSYDIIKAHNGEIKIESKEGGGSEFVVILPVV